MNHQTGKNSKYHSVARISSGGPKPPKIRLVFKHVIGFLIIIIFIGPIKTVHTQNIFDFKSQARKDENTLNFFSNMHGLFTYSPANKIKFANNFSSRFLLSRNTQQRDNTFLLTHNHLYSDHLSLDAGINSRIITDEEAFQQFSQHTIEAKPVINFTKNIELIPEGGLGISIQKEHEDYGGTYGLSSKGMILDDHNGQSGFSFISKIEDFGSRQNRKYDTNIYWSQEFSQFSSDSLSAGFFYNYNENYLAAEIRDVESIGKQNRYIRNDLRYVISKTFRTEIQSSYEWKDLSRISTFQEDSRTENALENKINLFYDKKDHHIRGNIRFRNEQRTGLNTAINMDTRLTSFQIQGYHQPWVNHQFQYSFYLSKYESDTPQSQKQDRDELRLALFASYRWSFSKFAAFFLQGEAGQSHQTYLFSRYSSNNYKNQLFRIKSGLTAKLLGKFKNSLLVGIDTNYNLFDFEELDKQLRSNLVKTWNVIDTVEYRVTQNAVLNYILKFNNVFVGNFDPQEILFYRNQDRITRQHQIRFKYSFPPSFSFMLGGIIYHFEQIDPTRRGRLQSRQFNYIPQLEVSYQNGRKMRLRLLAQVYKGTVTVFGDQKMESGRVFTKFDFNFDYFF